MRFSFKGAGDIVGAELPDAAVLSDWKVLRRAGIRPVRTEIVKELEIGQESRLSAMAVVDPQTVLLLSDSRYGLRCESPQALLGKSHRLQGREVLPKPGSGERPAVRGSGARTQAWLIRFQAPLR